MTGRNRRMQRQMKADYERLKPRPVVSEWMQSHGNSPEYKEAIAALERDGVRGLEPFIAKYRRTALASAKQGDFSELRELVRHGTSLNAEEQNFVADGIGQNVSKQRGAPRKTELSRCITLAHFWLTEVDGKKFEVALEYLKTQFGLQRSTISEHLKSGRKCIVTQEKITGYRLLLRLEYFDILNYFRDIDLKSE